MKDLLQTALLDAGLDFGDEDTAQNAEVKELPQLQKMTNCSDTPTAVSCLFQTHSCGVVNFKQP